MGLEVIIWSRVSLSFLRAGVVRFLAVGVLYVWGERSYSLEFRWFISQVSRSFLASFQIESWISYSPSAYCRTTFLFRCLLPIRFGLSRSRVACTQFFQCSPYARSRPMIMLTVRLRAFGAISAGGRKPNHEREVFGRRDAF